MATFFGVELHKPKLMIVLRYISITILGSFGSDKVTSQLTLVFAWIQFCYVSLCMDSVPVCYPMEYRFGL